MVDPLAVVHSVGMLTMLVVSVIAAALAVPASAAQVHPLKLVLHQIDVPNGYQLDKDETMLTSNALLRAYRPDMRALLARSGRVTGYHAEYTNYGPPKWRYVDSLVDVFRTPRGAQLYREWYVKLIRRESPTSTQPDEANLGDGALVYSLPSRTSAGPGTVVVWREGRVLAVVSCIEMNGHRTLALALARTQQRRIAAALR